MTRAAQAFKAAENRLDKEAEKAREAEADALMRETIDSTMRGLLGGLTPARRSKYALAIADASLDAYAAANDGPMAAAWCGKKAGKLCGEIQSGTIRRMTARESADRLFTPANDGEGA